MTQHLYSILDTEYKFESRWIPQTHTICQDQLLFGSLVNKILPLNLELEALKIHRLDIRCSTQQKEYALQPQFANLRNGCHFIVLKYAMMHDTTPCMTCHLPALYLPVAVTA